MLQEPNVVRSFRLAGSGAAGGAYGTVALDLPPDAVARWATDRSLLYGLATCAIALSLGYAAVCDRL